MSAHQHALNTQQALLLARGAEFLCAVPFTQWTFTMALREASTHCPEILLLDKLIQMFWFTYFLHQHELDKSWASISTRVKSYKISLSTYIPTTRIQSPASWASIHTRKTQTLQQRDFKHMHLELQSAQESSLTNYYCQHTSQQHYFKHLHLELQSEQESSLTKYSYQHTAQLLKHQYAKSLKLNIRPFLF